MNQPYVMPQGGLTYTFAGGDAGPWLVTRISPVTGASLPDVARLQISTSGAKVGAAAWLLRGFTSNARYSRAAELKMLSAVSPVLGRPEASAAALIPIRKSAEWWAMGQDERRAVFEERSKHIAHSMRHLPAVARRLHHSRDLGEPFDFITWFEYAPAYEETFEAFLIAMRATEEWNYVEREVDIRLVRC